MTPEDHSSNFQVSWATLKSLYWRSLKFPGALSLAIQSKVKPFYCLPLQRAINDNILAVDIHGANGFFAQLNWCLRVLFFCEANNLIPYLKLTSLNYVDEATGHDWFQYFFLNRAFRDTQTPEYLPRLVTKIHDIEELGLPDWCFTELHLHHASKLVNRYIEIKSGVTRHVDQYCETYFRDRVVLGIHFRGTDKVAEAPRVPWEYCRLTVCNYLDAHPEVEALFVASDEAPFVEYVVREFPGLEVLSHDDLCRSSGNVAVHMSVITIIDVVMFKLFDGYECE